MLATFWERMRWASEQGKPQLYMLLKVWWFRVWEPRQQSKTLKGLYTIPLTSQRTRLRQDMPFHYPADLRMRDHGSFLFVP